MKKLLVIGAGFLQSFVIRRARDMGYHVIAIDKNPDAVGFTCADESAVIDIVDEEACLDFAGQKGIDGVMTTATDYGVLSAAYVADRLGLPGLRYDVAQLVKNKYHTRQVFAKNYVDCVKQFYLADRETDLSTLAAHVRYPVMIKPCDGSGSKGAAAAHTPSALPALCREALAVSLSGKVLIEDFITGREYGADLFVHNGATQVMVIMSKHMTAPPVYAELGHVFPSGLSTAMEEKVAATLRKAVAAMGIDFGAVNMDYLITGQGEVCIIDVGARMGGNLIGSHIVPLGTGVDYMGNLIRAHVGDPIDMTPQRPARAVATRILALTPGRIVSLPDWRAIETKTSARIYTWLSVGDTIRPYHNNLDGVGYVVATSDSSLQAEGNAQRAWEMIENGIVRE